ncbi:MAG: TRAP transporter TatT component family protein, partial [Treponema sp.]|nr:TRAP transporter TatT component family protein [Treponema sp.]
MRKTTVKVLLPLLLASAAAMVLTACSINTLVANALTGDGASTVFTGDDDPELVGAALPFAIKMYEALLYTTPRHQGLMLTTGSLFVMYANAFVHGPADRLPFYEWEAREQGLERAKRLYLRGHRILLEALEQRHRGFSAAAENEDDLRRIL